MASSRSSFLLRSLMALGVVGAALAVDNSTASAQSERKVITSSGTACGPTAINDNRHPHLRGKLRQGRRGLRGQPLELPDLHDDERRVLRDRLRSQASTGYYGKTLWQPDAPGTIPPATVDFQQPTFTEDYAILTDLDDLLNSDLLLVGTLFSAARRPAFNGGGRQERPRLPPGL